MTLAIVCVQCGVCVRAFAHLAQLMYFIYLPHSTSVIYGVVVQLLL